MIQGFMLAQLVPAPMVRFFARPYVAGDSMLQALESAAQLWEADHLWSTLDLLGEDVVHQDQADANEIVYRDIIDAVAADARFAPTNGQGRRLSISLKPSAFTIDDPEAAFAPIRRLAEHAQRRSVPLTIDMESSRWTDLTLAHATALYREGFDVGTVLQSRLHRTKDDIETLPEGMRVRMVIGIYPEPADIAATDKTTMKQRLLDGAGRLLERGMYVEYGTHDDAFVARFAQEVAVKAPDRCEVQMLLGVPRHELQKKLLSGAFGPKLPVRLYVPFAVGWDDATAYLRRRMAESPSMVLLVLRNLLSPGR